MNKYRWIIITAAASVFFAAPAFSQQNELFLKGDLAGGEVINLDDDTISAFRQNVIETETIWTSGQIQFSGPTLWDVLEHYDAGSGNIELTALNDYSAVVARSLITKEAPIIANRIDGAPFGPRHKGPYWIVFPYDSSPEYRNQVVYAASVWQLTSITVLKD